MCIIAGRKYMNIEPITAPLKSMIYLILTLSKANIKHTLIAKQI